MCERCAAVLSLCATSHEFIPPLGAAARCCSCSVHIPTADVGKQVILSGEGRNFCGGIDLSVARSILKTVNDAQCPSRARETLRRDILAMQVCSCRVNGAELRCTSKHCAHDCV
jgi:hypothetical protein